jgi:hypothetical protein
MGTIKLTAIVPDSLLNMKVLHYAQELKYVDKDAQQDTYDAASFFIKNRHKAQRKAKFYINKCRSASCMQSGWKQASA